MQEWEYKVLDLLMLGGNIEPAVNKLGAEGWELEHAMFIFKRPKS